MLKILTYINTAALVAAVDGGAFVYIKRADYVNNMILTVQDQVIRDMQSSIKTPKIPSNTGSVLPFK